MGPPMEPTALAAAVVKQLGLAIKASGLYPPAHPGNVQAGEALLKALRAYAETHGQFRLIVGKHTLSVKGSGRSALKSCAPAPNRRGGCCRTPTRWRGKLGGAAAGTHRSSRSTRRSRAWSG